MPSPKREKKEYALPEEESCSLSKVQEPDIAYGYEAPRRYSYADYLTWQDDKTREIIDGIVRLMSPAANTNHASLSSRIFYQIERFIRRKKGKCKVFYAPFDVRLLKEGETANDKIYTVVQPDICVICDVSKLDKRGCLGAPDLVVEIQSPSTAIYDLTDKFRTYESAGVREYWVVFTGSEAITVFQLQQNGKYDKGTPYEFEGKLISRVLEGFEMDIEDLFKDLIK